jgi:hypothetical protein
LGYQGCFAADLFFTAQPAFVTISRVLLILYIEVDICLSLIGNF